MSVVENGNVLGFLNKCDHSKNEYLFRIMHEERSYKFSNFTQHMKNHNYLFLSF